MSAKRQKKKAKKGTRNADEKKERIRRKEDTQEL